MSKGETIPLHYHHQRALDARAAIMELDSGAWAIEYLLELIGGEPAEVGVSEAQIAEVMREYPGINRDDLISYATFGGGARQAVSR